MKDLTPIYLKDPDEIALENAFRSLPRVGEIALETSLSKLSFLLEGLEQAGFAGMEIKVFVSSEEKISLWVQRETGDLLQYRKICQVPWGSTGCT